MIQELLKLISEGEAPEWMTVEGLVTLNGGYLLEGETPKGLYWRVASAAADRLKKPELAERFFDIFWKGWLGLATPVAANMGTTRGLPISCFASFVEDSIDGIFGTVKEVAHLSSKGGGTAVHLHSVRATGEPISNSGKSEGVIPWCKVFDSTVLSVSQGSTRRGALAIYLPVEHKDIRDFLRIRRPSGDVNRQCLNLHHAVCISNEFMTKVKEGDSEARDLWTEILRTRLETGEPYLFFSDNVNNANPQMYKDLGFVVVGSNICTEVVGMTDENHSFVCCLSSLNLSKIDEWKDTDTVYLATWFLDAVMEEFVQKAQHLVGFERALNFARKGRMLGLGVMGYHTLLQSQMIPFASSQARQLNKSIFELIQKETSRASRDLAVEYGEPEWCKGYGVRNTHLVTVAPTVSNSMICGNVSQGIEPLAANIFVKGSAKGNLSQKNPTLAKLLQSYGKDTREVWDEILENDGSVQTLDFLSPLEKEVFKTAREIDQVEIIEQAADRQAYIDQSQSVNLFFKKDVDPNYVNKVHFTAWKLGLKTLYYCRGENLLSVKTNTKPMFARVDDPKPKSSEPEEEVTGFCSLDKSECVPCQG